MPVFLVEVELPDYCFISEVVHWMAIGRVPEIQWISDENADEEVDYRFYWGEMPENFEPRSISPLFEEDELRSRNLTFDPSYFDAAEECYGEHPDYLQEKIAELESKPKRFFTGEDGNQKEVWAEMAELYRIRLFKNRILQEIVDKVEDQLEPFLEVAWAKLFQLLQSGEIIAEALNFDKWHQLSDAGEYEKAGEFEKIAGRNFRLGFDWRRNEVQIGEARFVSTRVRTSDIIRKHDFLLEQGNAASVTKFGSFYRTAPTGLKRARGRPRGLDWVAMRDHLNALVSQEKIPENRESCIYELIAYAEKRWEKTVGRTTVQRRMADQLNAIYAQ